MSRSQVQKARRNRGTPPANRPAPVSGSPGPEIVDLQPRTTDDYHREQAEEMEQIRPSDLLLSGLGGVVEELLGIPLASHVGHHQGIDVYLQQVEQRLRVIEGAIFEPVSEAVSEAAAEDPGGSVKPY